MKMETGFKMCVKESSEGDAIFSFEIEYFDSISPIEFSGRECWEVWVADFFRCWYSARIKTYNEDLIRETYTMMLDELVDWATNYKENDGFGNVVLSIYALTDAKTALSKRERLSNIIYEAFRGEKTV